MCIVQMPLVKEPAASFFFVLKLLFMKTKFLLFCFLFTFCANRNNANAQVNVQDSLALVDLYNSTNGVNWVNNTNWLTSNPVSTWYGIISVSNGRVIYINLETNNLAGQLPSSIGNLQKLGTLRLPVNQLSGSIPSSIGNLVNLKRLNLYSNQLSGSIPSSIGNLANLQVLVLNGNQLNGAIPSSLGNLVNLQMLDLGSNHLSDTIPSSLGNLQNLTVLWLAYNQLRGSIPPSLGNLASLQNLAVHLNQLTGSIPSSLGKLANLRYLSLSFNQLSGSIPSSLGNLVNLFTLELSNNQLSGSIPSSLGNLVINLIDVYLSNNQLTGSIPSSLGNLERLGELHLNNNRLSGSIPSSLGNLNPSLSLSLNGNHFTFDGMELIAQTFPNAIYDKQKRIPIHQNGNTLSVSAGGTLSNNTYKWYRFRHAGDTIIIKGDSVFHPTQNGKYLVRVKNSVATKLTLYSDSIVYIAPAVIASAENSLQQYDKTNSFRVYPNPARDILFVQTNSNASFSLLNQSGKILLTKNVNGKGSINISGMAAGLYYLKNNSTEAVQKVIIAR